MRRKMENGKWKMDRRFCFSHSPFSILHSPENGMTLIELVIAIAVIAVLFPVMISALFNPVANAVWGDQMVQAMSLTQEKMEEIYATKANSSFSLGYSYITSS